jgi:hypothetical protein
MTGNEINSTGQVWASTQFSAVSWKVVPTRKTTARRVTMPRISCVARVP